MKQSDFIERYGGVYEHSPWAAERVHRLIGDESIDHDALARLMQDAVDNASREQQLDLIRAHPDLAGKAAVSGALTAESTEEQSSAGLDQCTADEFASFQSLNAAYKERFEFPFIMAVRNSHRAEILAAFAERLQNDPDTEFETALQEIHKIARLRLAVLDDST